VNIDPLYAFHGTDVHASQLHERGDLLTTLTEPCREAGASLLINDHFNATGTGFDLDRITGAGLAEWADSWILVRHREDPRVAEGRFRLLLEIGSRQWGGNMWDLDVDLGPFDSEAGEHTGEIVWSISPAGDVIDFDPRAANRDRQARARVTVYVEDHPFECTRTQVAEEAGGAKKDNATALQALLDDGALMVADRPRDEGGNRRIRPLVGPVSDSDEPPPGATRTGPDASDPSE
jgi:hypothetical protein